MGFSLGRGPDTSRGSPAVAGGLPAATVLRRRAMVVVGVRRPRRVPGVRPRGVGVGSSHVARCKVRRRDMVVVVGGIVLRPIDPGVRRPDVVVVVGWVVHRPTDAGVRRRDVVVGGGGVVLRPTDAGVRRKTLSRECIPREFREMFGAPIDGIAVAHQRYLRDSSMSLAIKLD